MKHLFIVNPVAGKKKAAGMIPEIEKIMSARKEEFYIEQTRYAGHAAEIAEKYSGGGDFRIYSLGGDGTLNEVLNGIVNHRNNVAGSSAAGSSLAVIPAGSGNDFFRCVSDNSTAKILSRTINGFEKTIDIGKVNGKYFLNISSLGFDAEIAHSADRLKQIPFIPGGAAYVLSIFTTILKNRTYHLNISIDGESLSEKLLLAAVANGNFYGGGIIPAPEAKVDDGLFDICTVKSLSKPKILVLFPKYVKGKHGILKEVSFYKCRNIGFNCDEPFPLNIDGEVVTVSNVSFEIIPNKLKFVFPVPLSQFKE